MITLSAQSAVAFCLLVFAFAAVQVTRALPPHERVFRYAWACTAAAFLIQGANMGLHSLFAVLAYRGGPDSTLWNAVLVWHPILNHSRTFLLTAYCVVLAAALFRAHQQRPFPPLAASVAVMVAGMVVGGAVGWQEEAFSGLSHYSAVAVWDIMELLALLALLFVGLLTGGMDRALWAAVGVNAFVLALSVLWFASLSRIDISGQWAPRPYHIHFSKAALYVLMILIAHRHRVRLRRGRPARAFLERGSSRVVASLHG